MEMTKPTKGHQKLDKLVGAWKGKEKMHPSPWDPKGGTADASIENRKALDGLIVIHDYEQRRDGKVSFQGHGVFSFDAEREIYSMHWFDSMGMPANEFRGKLEGDVLTLTNQTPQGQSRAVYDLSGKDAYKFKMDVSQDGKQWKTFMEGSYTKTR